MFDPNLVQNDFLFEYRGSSYLEQLQETLYLTRHQQN